MSRDHSTAISPRTAELLLDYGGTVSPEAAREQLLGAVAIHNILERDRVAYLADEVGMGKTLVALGVLALYRHFNAGFRVLVIAPRENIQKKWIKEFRNFVANHVKVTDLRVKSLQGTPARPCIACENLIDLVREATVNPDRDFFLKLTSFSLPVGNDTQLWKKKRDELRRTLPWMDDELLTLKCSKEIFKDNYARAICCALPKFHLVIVDEGHNLKHGLKANVAARNRVLAAILGHPRMEDRRFKEYGPRASRVLFLSATPVEDDYRQLWNQMDVVGLGGVAPALDQQDLPDERKRDAVRRLLIRRVNGISVAGRRLTKNLYRREWRGGGVRQHDDPLDEPDERQRLIVALVQKKVTEILSHARFNNSFQIGMLASFESFLVTAKVDKTSDDEEIGNFDDADQTDNSEERKGVDVGSINQIANSYRKAFNSEMPHPKMDAVVDQLSGRFDSGDKALVFVRRIASVKELQRKLEDRYNEWLFARLMQAASPAIIDALRPQFERYEEEHQERGHDDSIWTKRIATPAPGATPPGDDSSGQGGFETFFAWFVRGEGPDGVLSGALVQKRFTALSGTLCTFFSDNHVAAVLDVDPAGVREGLVEYLGRPAEDVEREIRRHASALLPKVKKQQRRTVYLAVQQAALTLISEHAGDLKEHAEIILEERYREVREAAPREDLIQDVWTHLSTETFWTAIRRRAELRSRLWPTSQRIRFREAFREQELRRELLSAMARLGNPFVDLYLLIVNRLGTLEMRARAEGEDDAMDPAEAYLDLLEDQMNHGGAGLTSFRELEAAASNFELILSVNAPETREKPLGEAATLFAQLLREQQPVGGMFGQVNQTLVRQFRMPGYPLILLTTDLLQEGEDLHLFCSSVYHYGISWMPSSMEQRIGRIDRVSSATERRLSCLHSEPTGDEKLQVLYPHLQETVEVLQVRRVLERMTRFMKLMHEDLLVDERGDRRLDIAKEVQRGLRALEPTQEELKSAFPVQPEMLEGRDPGLAVSPDFALLLRKRFEDLRGSLAAKLPITWDGASGQNGLMGQVRRGTRRQPFGLYPRSIGERVFVHCVSPIRRMPVAEVDEDVASQLRRPVTIEGFVNGDREQIVLSAEGDVLLGDEAWDLPRVAWLVRRVTEHADEAEAAIFETDEPMEEFRERLEHEATDANSVD